MSAFVLGKTHIDLLITAGLTLPHRSIINSKLRWRVDGREHELTPANADQIGVTLWAENHASVHHAYPQSGDDLPGPADFDGPDVLTYTHEPIPGPIDPVVVLKAINCYDYQSCEHPGWNTSSARAFTVSLGAACIHALPGYAEAPWGFHDRRYFTRATS